MDPHVEEKTQNLAEVAELAGKLAELSKRGPEIWAARPSDIARNISPLGTSPEVLSRTASRVAAILKAANGKASK